VLNWPVIKGENMNQNWDDLRYFLAVSRTNSFVAAATRLHVTHSTVSRRISSLEASLETQLFLRTEKGCHLTPAGEALLPYAEQVETTSMNLVEHIHGKDSQLSGTIRIGAPDGLGNCFLATHLGQFQERHPNLEVELIAVPHYYSLTKREIDILITITKPISSNIVARKITDYRLGLFASQKYLSQRDEILAGKDLSGHHLIDYIEDLLYDENLRFLNELAPGQKAKFHISTLVGQMNAIVAGAGIGVVPYFMAHAEPTLVPVIPELHAKRSFWLQVNPESRQLARVRATIDFIVSQIEKNRKLFVALPNDYLAKKT
jgi:DNA-binding transcriptional LysR family regulator